MSETGRINLSDGGYLLDPDSEWGHIYKPDVVPFDSIAQIPCLALLGEPGIGKTQSMQAQREAIEKRIEKEGNQLIWLDLCLYSSEDRLVRDLFKNERFISWAKGTHRIHLFLDSLDECLLRINTLAALLVDELRRYPVERLCLRIVCRTAEWPIALETGLERLWGEDKVGVYELTPLRRKDVSEAAKANNLDPEVFLAEIDRMKAVPLAFKPITLSFLLNIYRGTGQFPSTQAELYLRGCRLLCEETSENRRAAGLTGNFTTQERMAAAARIAAVTMFANRYAIWVGVDRGDVPEEDTTVQELCAESDSVEGAQSRVTEGAIKETLSTALFSSPGPNRMGWAHQTYAEFLAAHYLVQHQMTLTQMMSLIVHPGDPQGKLVPQLYEVAAWLAGMEPNVFREITTADPEVLLRSDVATTDEKTRASLVQTLLRLCDEEKLSYYTFGTDEWCRRLAYPGLAERLRSYICDSAKGLIVRRVAIRIAEACKLQVLQGDLVHIALDTFQPLSVRISAARAISHIGDDETKAKLKPLATGEAGDDPDDELKGYGLRAVWPVHMTAKELFPVLAHPKRKDFFGAYWRFVLYDLVPHLQPADLPMALEWVLKQESRHKLPHPFEELVDAIMLRGWGQLQRLSVMKAFARAALSRLQHHDEIVRDRLDPPFLSVLSADDNKRRQVLEAMLPMIRDPKKDSLWLVYSKTPIVLNKDIPWMIERLEASVSKQTQRVWAQLIARVFDWREPKYLDAILTASENNRILSEALARFFKPIELNSPEARKMKKDYLETQEWQKRHRNRPLLVPSLTERIALLLDQFESGNLAAWWRLNREIRLEPNGIYFGNGLESDLTVFPGWKTADGIIRARIVMAAKRYVLEQDPETSKWLGTNIIAQPAFAGYRALRLLLKEAPGFVSTIPAEVWKKWAPIILAYPTSSGAEGEEPHHTLVGIAYQQAPTEIIETLIIIIDRENREYGSISITRKVEHCWDDRLANALLIKAKDKKLRPECMGSLLSDLLDHTVDEARVFAESLIPLPLASSGEKRSRAIVAARVLMAHAQGAGWSTVWPAIQRNTEFGREVITTLAHGLDRSAASIAKQLTEDQLADLYIWLVQQYPYAEDPGHEGGHSVGPRESVADFRNSILHHLERRGTNKSCDAIRRIGSEFPGEKYLRWTLFEAQNITRRRTWVPPRPGDILRMASNQQTRLVQSGDQLISVLVESLKKLEAKLQGEMSAVQFLWDKDEPKDENSFSDFVKLHLDEDLTGRGIIVNREVRIHRGEKTDIHVDAAMQDSQRKEYDSATVIIEVKGCWNQELDQAMETQLVDNYMKDSHCQHGLYLVGWFNCEQWNNKDYRKQRAPGIDICEAQRQFDTQAAELSKETMRIKAFVINTALRKARRQCA